MLQAATPTPAPQARSAPRARQVVAVTGVVCTPAKECKAAGLVYVDDSTPGVTRRLVRSRFQYFAADGTRIRDAETIKRIDALAIPPAYVDVWICPKANGHIQATGRDARGRKQYRYHDAWHELRGADKYGQLPEFAGALPRIRRQVRRDMARAGLTQEKLAAVVVRLLETTLVRIGTPAYARANGSYGLTTLKRRHITVAGGRIRLRFRGKSGVEHDLTVTDRRIAAVVKRCMEIPGQELFRYLDDEGQPRGVDSGSVNDYLREAGRADFTAKHYRTWAGSVLALALLRRRPWESETQAKRTVVEVVKEVARRLGNTPAVCRECYIHPRVLETYLAGELRAGGPAPASPRGLNADERRLLAFLKAQA
ncbi:DNA topoisomerase [Bordetella genomosp. 10]|uniref:DNA topoisomerase n=1 Tax=Bordetella genomosp. 10 TaxID=1416804 RepID=A0A261S3K5_9BORD|nr:DNA topoisomerase IB [Bordetella genomosp. 10]OZI31926.1 DNA topoisomerase [Bordetella genomosp. 10]